MKNLARHIEFLLRDNDCVILPGFGGFIAHEVPAYYVEEEASYYPPSRRLSFNATITMNDGLLVQSYMKSYQVDYARATYMVDIAIEQLADTLDEEGTATLPHIGTLTQDIHQSLQFTPDIAGIASPMHFGLGSLVIKELSQLQQPAEIVQKGVTATRKAKTIEIRINKEMLHRVVSTAAVFLLLLMIALPTGIHRPTDVASLQLTELIKSSQVQAIATAPAQVETSVVCCDTLQPTTTSHIMEEPSPMAESAVVVETPAKEEAKPAVETPPAPAVEMPQPTIAVAQSTKVYHIIVASLPNHRGAEETLSQFASMGYPEVSLVERDNRVRISLMQFTDKDEANTHLSTLRQNPKFQNAWLLAVRN